MENTRLRAMLPVIGILIIIVSAGCGASKSYVDQAVAGEQARNAAALNQVVQDAAANKAEIDRLKTLTQQLEQKADMAINQAKGFENYQVIWEGEIFFDFNSDKITVEAQARLDEAGDKMITNRGAVAELIGYCDPTGSDVYNMELGLRRSMATKYYLVDNFGINLYRIFMVSHGKRKAVESVEGRESYAKQRKVIIKIWGRL